MLIDELTHLANSVIDQAESLEDFLFDNPLGLERFDPTQKKSLLSLISKIEEANGILLNTREQLTDVLNPA